MADAIDLSKWDPREDEWQLFNTRNDFSLMDDLADDHPDKLEELKALFIAGPSWDGAKPEGITDVIRSETPFVFNVTRTQLFGPDDLKKVEEIQGSYDLQPLSRSSVSPTGGRADSRFPQMGRRVPV